MPMPKPKTGQSHDDFMDMCMGDDMMMDDYPEDKQRLAVCEQQWENMHEEDALPSDDIERRTLDVELRVSKEGETKKIEGHAAVFDKLSEDLGGFREIIDSGAFAVAIKRDDVRALFNHDPNYVLGRSKAKTLRLAEDDAGLAVEIDPPDTSFARDLMVSMERGDINQMSFAFRVDGKNGESWQLDGKECKVEEAFMAMWDGKKHEIIRHVRKARLFDVSLVTYAAYPQTSVKVRSLAYKKQKPPIPKLDEMPVRDGTDRRLARQRLNYGYPK